MKTEFALGIVIALGVVFWLLNRREEKKHLRQIVTEKPTTNSKEETCPMLARQEAGYIGIFSEDD